MYCLLVWVIGIEKLGGVLVDREVEQVLIKIGVNGTKISAVRDNVASQVASQETLTNGVSKLGSMSITRKGMVDKVNEADGEGEAAAAGEAARPVRGPG